MTSGRCFSMVAIAFWMLLSARVGVAQTSAWFDVTAYGAACNGSTNDTSAIQSALNAANAVSGTVFTPPGRTCVIASQLVMDNFIGVKVIGGFGSNPLPGNVQANWTFSGVCASGAACLSMRSTSAVSFHNIGLFFSNPNATGAMVDLSHSSLGNDSSLITFDGVAFAGASNSVGPIVLDQNTDEVSFEGWTSFAGASVFVQGPVDNSHGFSDKTVFDHVNFSQPGTAAIQNASVAWTISNSIFQIFGSPSCTPVLQYVNGYSGQQALLVSGNVVNSTSGQCSNTFNVFSLPAVTGNAGGATFLSNLFIPGFAAANQTEIYAGANQVITVKGNVFNHMNTAVSVSSDVYVDFGENVFSDVTTQIGGAPAAGMMTLNGGNSIVYSGLTVGPGSAITNTGSGGRMSSAIDSGAVSMTTAPIAGGSCGSAVTVASADVLSGDAVLFSFNAPVGPNPGVLIVQSWITASSVNFMYCNPSSNSLTPMPATLNWRVVR